MDVLKKTNISWPHQCSNYSYYSYIKPKFTHCELAVSQTIVCKHVVRTYVSMYVCMNARMYACTYVCKYVRTYVYIRIYVCIYMCVWVYTRFYIYIYIYIFISIQPWRPGFVTGMVLPHCILSKFLGVVCHCFPPPLDVPTLAARCFRPQRRERS